MSNTVIKNLDRLILKLNSLGGNLQNAMNEATQQITTKAAADARRLAPTSTQTQSRSDGEAALRNSISESYTKEGGVTVGHVVVANPHAANVYRFCQ